MKQFSNSFLIRINITFSETKLFYDKGFNVIDAIISKDLKNREDVSYKISFPGGTKHGTVFEADEKILSNLLNKK